MRFLSWTRQTTDKTFEAFTISIPNKLYANGQLRVQPTVPSRLDQHFTSLVGYSPSHHAQSPPGYAALAQGRGFGGRAILV